MGTLKNETGYATVNGIKMYYEIQGSGAPIILLHGAYMTIDGPMREIATALSKTRKVIMTEFQGHGRTMDIDRDITYENLADDVSGLIRHLKIDSTDVMGFSVGGGVVLQLAIRHPKQVKKIISFSAAYSDEGMLPAFRPLIPTITPAMFEGSVWKRQYDSLSPHPKRFPILVEKLKKLDMTSFNWETDYAKLKHPLFLLFGDADGTTMDHVIKMLAKRGGSAMGDMGPLPNVSLAVLPHTTHLGVLGRINWFIPMLNEFLSNP